MYNKIKHTSAPATFFSISFDFFKFFRLFDTLSTLMPIPFFLLIL